MARLDGFVLGNALAAVLRLALALLHRKRGTQLTRETALPFGPPLASAIWIIWLYGFPADY